MPEITEVEVFKDTIKETSLDRKIDSIFVDREDALEDITPQAFTKALEGDTFTSISRHGKYLFIKTKKDHTVLMHFGMTGSPYFYEGSEPKPNYPRVTFHFEDDGNLAFECVRMLGKVSVIDSKEQYIKEKELGIDALDPDLDKEMFRELIKSSRGYIKSTLMNQQLIAGLGNVLSDEIMFQTGIHPKSKIDKLTDSDIDLLYEKMHEICEYRIKTKNDPDKVPDDYILNQRHENGKCPKCGGDIKNVKVAGRSSYFCEKCQVVRQ